LTLPLDLDNEKKSTLAISILTVLKLLATDLLSGERLNGCKQKDK
jgi:hypothetical protein